MASATAVVSFRRFLALGRVSGRLGLVFPVMECGMLSPVDEHALRPWWCLPAISVSVEQALSLEAAKALQ